MTRCARCHLSIVREEESGYWADSSWSVLCDPRIYGLETHTPRESPVPETPLPEEAPSQAYVVTLPGKRTRRFSTRLRALAYLLRITS